MCINRSFALSMLTLGLIFCSANGMNFRRPTASSYRVKKTPTRTTASKPRMVRRPMTNVSQSARPELNWYETQERAKNAAQEELVQEIIANEHALKKINPEFEHQMSLERKYNKIIKKIDSGKPWWMLWRSQEGYDQLMKNKRNDIYNQLKKPLLKKKNQLEERGLELGLMEISKDRKIIKTLKYGDIKWKLQIKKPRDE
jgi:hypothetical protein